jgi:guanylate kinase
MYQSYSTNFILLVGPSGSGKTTIANELYKSYGLSQVYSYTTRPKRGPKDIEHTFITDEQFDELDADNMAGYTEYNGYRYCSTMEQIEENDIYVIDPAGIDYFWENYSGGKNIIIVYIKASRQDIFNRLVERDGIEKANERINYDEQTFADAELKAHKVVENKNVKTAARQIYKIWKNED